MSAEDLKQVIATHAPRLVDGAVDDLATLLSDLKDISPAVLAPIVAAQIDSPRFAHFRKPTGPPAGSAQAAAASYQGAVGLSRVPAGTVVDASFGMRSAPPQTHASLNGPQQPAQAPATPWNSELSTIAYMSQQQAGSLQAHIGERAAADQQAFGIVGGIPAYTRMTPRKNRGQ
jgi:hypothetical protein